MGQATGIPCDNLAGDDIKERDVQRQGAENEKGSPSIRMFNFLFFLTGCAEKNDFPTLKGPYLGQQPPGLTPELFAPGVISTERYGEAGGAFSKNGDVFLFNRRTPPEEHKTISYTESRNGVWTKPAPVPFNSEFNDWSFNFVPGSSTLFFSSKRPSHPGSGPSGTIWSTQYSMGAWAEPTALKYPVNTSESFDSHPSLTRERTLYFHSNRAGGYGQIDLYRAGPIDGEYTVVQNLGDVINTQYWEYDVFVGPDEDYILFSSDRPGGWGKHSDIYISFRSSDGNWTAPKNLGKAFCDSGVSGATHDGKYLFITSEKRRAGIDDITWVDIKIIEPFRPKGLK